jgi:stearoyl-CoA desaturase (Delta-9 desaturase)
MTKKPKLHLGNTIFFVGSALAAAALGTWYITRYGLGWSHVFLFILMLTLTLNAVSAGYHRLYAHRTHEAASWLKVFYLLFGAAAFEQSCMKWATEHRAHHRDVDTDLDPYNIKKGAFWAHIGWIIYQDRVNYEVPKDLAADPLIRWQDRHWTWLGILFGFGFPAAIGALWGDALGGFIFGGVVRMVAGHHFTFMINSLAHMVGSQPYSDKNSSKDSWITAVFTYGEGYHNFHHWNPGDYRNGVRMFHWDPPKWFICAMSWFGQTWDLKRVSEETLAKAKAEMLLKSSIEKHAHAHVSLKERMEEQYAAFLRTIEDVAERRRAWMVAARASTSHEVELLKLKFEDSRKKYRQAQKAWRSYIRGLNASPASVNF